MQIPTINELKKTNFEALEKFSKKPYYEFTKRIFDIIAAIIALFVFSIFWIIIVIWIRIDSKGKAIFSHERVGQNGRLFRLYKFRTMYQGVKNQELAPTSPEDERITKVGQFLRRTSLDELPQLINIIKGEMSLVGPRPEMPFLVKNYTATERKRLLVKPGLTGLWQIMGRKNLPLHKNLEYDFYYIIHRSFYFDCLIILKTIFVVLLGTGAF